MKEMRLKNFLIVVKDMERSKRFYYDLFGLEVITDFGENVILSGGLVLQEKKIWDKLIGKKSVCGDSDAELYFEENNLDYFLNKLERYPEPVRYLNKLTEHPWGQQVLRIYDPDGHVIEIKFENSTVNSIKHITNINQLSLIHISEPTRP